MGARARTGVDALEDTGELGQVVDALLEIVGDEAPHGTRFVVQGFAGPHRDDGRHHWGKGRPLVRLAPRSIPVRDNALVWTVTNCVTGLKHLANFL